MEIVLQTFGAVQKAILSPAESSCQTSEVHAVATAGITSTKQYEAFQKEHTDLIIRIPGSFKKMGIEVASTGTIVRAPGDLFDHEYRVIAVDGKRFCAGLDSVSMHAVLMWTPVSFNDCNALC